MKRLYIFSLLLVPSIARGGIDLDDSTFTDKPLGLHLEVPEGWTLHRQTGYPSLLAVLLKPGRRSSISLTLGPEGSGPNLRTFVQQNEKAVREVGLEVKGSRAATVGGRKVWQLDLADRSGATSVRQLYLTHGSHALILTLSTPTRQLKQTQFDLVDTVELLELTRPAATRTRPEHVSLPKRPDDDGSLPPEESAETSSHANKPQSEPASQPASGPASRPAARPGKPLKLKELQVEGLER
jgi:hypothetical protein